MTLNEVLITHVARQDCNFRRPGKEWLMIDRNWRFIVAEGSATGEEVLPTIESFLSKDWEVTNE